MKEIRGWSSKYTSLVTQKVCVRSPALVVKVLACAPRLFRGASIPRNGMMSLPFVVSRADEERDIEHSCVTLHKVLPEI